MVALRDAVNRVEPSFAELVDGVAALKPATGDRLSANAPRFLETA
jgi:hypothetical protein